MIKIQGLNKFFNKGRQNEIHVINNVSLELPESGMVAIFGKSGCGKTTLLNVIGGLDKFASGLLEIDGCDVAKDPDGVRNQYVGYIFQNYNLNNAVSCFDNVADALRLCGARDEREIESRVMAALANVGMDKYSKRTPDTLSGGQQQRIAIARAIVKNPRIILADEPTGNLDEANTVMIMDLLKAISKDHLVLLVTHEADLVDYYCDKVIELSDGQVVGTRENQGTSGFFARDKNHIYLGELERHEIKGEGASIEFFGDAPETPIKLRIVNNGGKLYIEVGSPAVQVLDATSEVKLREGVYEVESKKDERDIDMSALPPMKGERFGRLFSFASSVRSGFYQNFKQRRKGKKLLFACLSLFSAVLVLMSAVFGTSIGRIIEASRSYNHNSFYVYMDSEETFKKVKAAYDEGLYGIDYITLVRRSVSGDDSALFSLGDFETFNANPYRNAMSSNMLLLSDEVSKNRPVVLGKGSDLENGEIAITKALADALIEKSPFGYIEKYSDLIGLALTDVTVDGEYCRVAGIVEGSEREVFANELVIAKLYYRGSGAPRVKIGADYGYPVEDGKTILAVKHIYDQDEYPANGDTIKIQGIDLSVINRMDYYTTYQDWMSANKIEKLAPEDFYKKKILEKTPDISEEQLQEELLKGEELYYPEWLSYYYAEADSFLKTNKLFDAANIFLWLAVEKGELCAKCDYLNGNETLYVIERFKNDCGRYPTMAEFSQNYHKYNDMYDKLWELESMFSNTFYSNVDVVFSQSNIYFVSESDYIKISKSLGASHKTSIGDSFYYDKYDDSYDYYGKSDEFEGVVTLSLSADPVAITNVVVPETEFTPSTTPVYALIHTTDPKATEAFVIGEFSDIVTLSEWFEPLLTPSDIFKKIITNSMEDMFGGVVAMAVVLVLMSVCMYFIMRSSLMSRIKEVGIYRAIGVSKKNLVFKFFVESLVLAGLTVFVGYIAVSAFLIVCQGLSAMVADVLYYPLWLALVDLGILLTLAVGCGILPITALLKRTPSEILAKYDI